VVRSIALVLVLFVALAMVAACRDVSRFSSKNDHFEGSVVKGSFVRAGIGEDARMCLTLDTNHLQDGPGALTTSDGRFSSAALRPIPQIWHDPLSTLSFGDGRLQNLIYVATRSADAGAEDVFVIVSLMQSDAVEVRLLRGAPVADDAGASAAASGADAIFGVFNLERRSGSCAF
jgi:hypothetical protein